MRTIVLLFISGVAVFAETCPWLNEATAAGALGGAVTRVSVKQGQTGEDGTCTFVRQTGRAMRELRVEVEPAPAPMRCRSEAVPLKGIGNEARACSEGNAEQVISRVRDRAFTVRLSSTEANPQRSALREQARKIAELVAGSLF